MSASTQPAVSGNAPALASALRKARWRILPLLSVCYLVAYTDRANISYAAEGMTRDLHLSPRVYGLGAGLFFLSYAACEIPANALLLRFGARRWLSRIMLTWGLVAAAMTFVRTPLHFYAARLLLGCAEAGYFPGALYFLSNWFPTAVRARTLSLFYVALPLSSLVMGGLAGTLLGLDGRLGLAGWQWMFLVEAAPAVLLAAAVWLGLPESISAARWLTPEERSAFTAQLAPERSLAPGHATHDGLARVLRSRRMWAVGLVYFLELGTFYAITFSLPTVLGGITGWTPAAVGYLLAASGLLGAVLMLLGASFSDRSRQPRPFLVGGFTLMALALLSASLHLRGAFGAAALLLAVLTFYTFQGPMLSVMTTLLPGTASALAIAAANTCGLVGGFAGPYAMGWMREGAGSYAPGLGLLAGPCALAALVMFRLSGKPGEAARA